MALHNANGSGSKSGTVCDNQSGDAVCFGNLLASYYCYVQPTTVGNGGTMTLTLSWNDGVADRSFTSAALDLTMTSQLVSGIVPVLIGSYDGKEKLSYQLTWTNAVVGANGWLSAVCSIKRN